MFPSSLSRKLNSISHTRCNFRAPNSLVHFHVPDLVLHDAKLLAVFEPLLSRKDELNEPLFFYRDETVKALWRTTMKALLAHLRERSSLRIGVIIDETQKITEAVEKDSLAYFKRGWYGWQRAPGNAFVRMDIASSHGA